MIGLLSFIAVLAILVTANVLIVTTILNASGAILCALRGDMPRRENFVNFGPRRINQSAPMLSRQAPLRAAA